MTRFPRSTMTANTADQQHTLVRSPAFNNPLVNGVSLRQAFGNWYFGRPGPTHVIE